jgi:hypothetical protein
MSTAIDIYSQLEPTLTSFALTIILYDSNPIIARLNNTDKSYVIDPSPLIYMSNPEARPVRMITAIAEGKDEVTVRVQNVKPSSNAPVSLAGWINPLKIISADRQSTFPVLHTFRFVNTMGAADYMFEQCWGFHIAYVYQFGTTTLMNPHFHGTYIPFLYSLTNTFPQVINYDIYPNGFDAASATNTGVTPLQVAPLVCRPLNATEDERQHFRAQVHCIASVSRAMIGSFLDDNQTSVEMYKIQQPSIQ